ncbi:MAG: glycoside hydrolase family 30 beta sandwich domain-containing protein [Eubacteriales bacterium]|nr:glycoside hydrolase family 30 beta sandwich domain-containing protein [Eubacteriales bacterium]
MKMKVIKTIKNSDVIMKEFPCPAFEKSEIEVPVINVVPYVEYQTIDGFGGAFTEAAAVSLDKISPENRAQIIKMYFDDKEGIGYNYCRTHINSCDFSVGNWTYVEEEDKDLSTFSIDHDKQSIIPMIKDALKYNKDMFLFSSPWSPPAYMKDTNMMNKGGKLLAEYYDLWAEYYVKYIQALKAEGINISAITVQNEPKATQTWDSCVYTAEEERDFVKNHLGKKMKEIGVKVMFWDHNKERVMDRAKVMLDDKEAAQYIDAIAVHWYSGDHFEQLDMFNKMYPDKKIIFSEGCQEYSLGKVDSWSIGERYAFDMIGNFNNYLTAFTDWNLVLDEQGGPNHVGNFCDAPIMVDTKKDKIHIHNSYYYIGHFSKYVKKGAKRIGFSKYTNDLSVTAFKNPDGQLVVIVLNDKDVEKTYNIRIDNHTSKVTSQPHSIATYLIEEYK